MAFFNTRECLQEMKTRLKMFPLKCSLALQTFVDIKYHYLDLSSTKCSQLLSESSEIVCETGQPPLPFPTLHAHCARCQLDTGCYRQYRFW